MSDLEQVKALDSTVADAINAGDAATVASAYTDTATILPPGTPLLQGKTAIQAYWQAGIDGGLTDMSIVPSSVEITGDSSITVGVVTGRVGDTQLTGKYMVIGQRTKDGWRIHQDIWNFDA